MERILVIDGEKLIVNLLKRVLNHYGYEVVTANNGVEGIEKFQNGVFDLVITDLCMLGIDGNEVVRLIRNSERGKTPIIGISGTPYLFRKNGPDQVLPKPFPINLLVENVEKLLKVTQDRNMMLASCFN